MIKNKSLNFAVIGLAHSHIYGMTNGLINAGAKLKYVYDDNKNLVDDFIKSFPEVTVCNNLDEILRDEFITLVASADVPSKRADLAIKCMTAGKDFFVDKAPFIRDDEFEAVKSTIEKTKRKYFVFYSESIANEVTLYAYNLIKSGKIGKVFHIEGIAPHRLNPESRPDWFFDKNRTGGIITDLGSQQIHQFLKICETTDVTVDCARTANYNNQEYPNFDDFGDFTLTAKNGITGYFRVDWSSPKGLGTWGDIRLIIEGSKGHIELRKNCNLGFDNQPNHILIVTDEGIKHEIVTEKTEITLFADIISDCLYRTDNATELNIDLISMLLAIKAQKIAEE